MAIYESLGYQNNTLHLYDKKTSFDYIREFKPIIVPETASLDEFKRTKAPYCICGTMKQGSNGTYIRKNENLISRDLIFLDYDNINSNPEDFKQNIDNVLFGYSYILYPTINHTVEKPRYRLVVKTDKPMNEYDYKETCQEIADLVGLPFDLTSLTWSQLQGLPVTKGNHDSYDRVVNIGISYPVNNKYERPPNTSTIASGLTVRYGKSTTMKIIETLLNGFGSEGGRNVAVTKFVGSLFSKWVDCDLETAYTLTKIANDNTPIPLSIDEIDKTFTSMAKAEYRKRG